MNHSELRQHFYHELSPLYLQGELQAMYHWCVQEIMGWSRGEAYMHNSEAVGNDRLSEWNMAINRLKQHEPVQYIFSRAYFHGLVLLVDKNVLIPRPETEELVQLVLDTHRQAGPLSVLDMGTGSGCIALALKHARPDWQVSGCDVSSEALTVARRNAEENNLEVGFFFYDLLDTETHLPLNPDIVVSNPPYIPQDKKATLASNVLDHEPHLALFAPAGEPFFFFRRIVEEAVNRGTKAVFFETHATETETLVATLSGLWPGEVCVHRDMQGKDRFLELRRD